MTINRKKLEDNLMHFVRSRSPRHAAASPRMDLLETGLLDAVAHEIDELHRRGAGAETQSHAFLEKAQRMRGRLLLEGVGLIRICPPHRPPISMYFISQYSSMP